MQEIVIAADHAGFILKQKIIDYLIQKGYQVIDLGCGSEEAVDYPDYAQKLAKEVRENRGILVCGSGIGMSIAANRFSHIRAALCGDVLMAQLAREHNDANILVMGARVTTTEMALNCVNVFLTTEFKAGRHKERVDKL